ncbi:MAG: cytochrome c biogenesis protein CcsA [Opitutales bacterium]|nr:cytochrome c biogenesis protein CcsA [Opitutales bacterium]
MKDFNRAQKITAGILILVCFLLFARSWMPESPVGEVGFAAFSELPVQEGGRLKPIDTVARTSKLIISGRQRFIDEDGNRYGANEWFMRLLLDPGAAADDRVFRIDHPDVVGLLGEHNEERRFFSLRELSRHFDTIRGEFEQINPEPALRSSYENALANLQKAIVVYDNLAYNLVPPPLFGGPTETYSIIQRALRDAADMEEGSDSRRTVDNALRLFENQFQRLSGNLSLQPIPPGGPNGFDEWHNLGVSLQRSLQNGEIDPIVLAFGRLSKAYRQQDAGAADAELAILNRLYSERADAHQVRKVPFERSFNHLSPFIYSMFVYMLAFLVAALSWLFWGRSLALMALWIMAIGFAVHTFGMGARIYIQERPPVTNLYSSAIFVGWGAVLLCLFIEKRFLNGIAAAAASLLGFASLIVAHYLSYSGDTLEMMQAVLDSNFWLATHVPTVTIGYSAAFLAGFLGIVYILRDRLFGGLPKEMGRGIESMVYGVTCFALLFSFIGTVLGGIWADQSWGRFWGWDPKENGALMIVLWCALILHARWGKVVGPTGIMQMAITGNIITAWSWFGTNMLGVGLHSYGFMDSAFFWLMAFIVSQLLVISIGWVIPQRRRSLES